MACLRPIAWYKKMSKATDLTLCRYLDQKERREITLQGNVGKCHGGPCTIPASIGMHRRAAEDRH